MEILFTWIGTADYDASQVDSLDRPGPVMQALKTETFDKVILIQSVMPKNEKSLDKKGNEFLDWLKSKSSCDIELMKIEISNPTDVDSIYKASEKAILETFESHGRDQNLTFHLSPGTWAMSSVWYILSETKYPARLIQSSPEAGVQDVNIPFEISAERLSANQLAQSQNITRIATAFTGSDGEIISRSSSMRRLFSKISKANKYSFPVLIESEQGCDQGHLAKTLHETGSRSQSKFHHIDWKEIELENKRDLFLNLLENASGTLFIENVDRMNWVDQKELLNFLQSKTHNKTAPRIICGSGTNLLKKSEEGDFSIDLFYQLAVVYLKIPPVRDREGDIGPLLERTLQEIEPTKSLSVSAKKLLIGHKWPGNDFELENTVKRIAMWSDDSIVSESDVLEALYGTGQEKDVPDILGRNMSQGVDLHSIISEVANHYISRAIADSNGNKSDAAKLVGLTSYQTLSNWMNKYGIT